MPALTRSKEAHVIHSALGLPIDEATRPELVELGTKTLRAENVRQLVRGAATKRNGFALLPTVRFDATAATAGYKLFADGRSALRVTDTLWAESYSPQAQAWSPLSRMPEATARIIDVSSMGIASYLEDVDATNGYVAISWLAIAQGGFNNVYLAIVDQASGSIVRAPETIGVADIFSPAYFAVQGNYFVAVQYNPTGTKLSAWFLDATSAATIAVGWVAFATSLSSDTANVPANFTLHTLPHATTPRIAVLYVNTGGGTNRLTLKAFDVTGVIQTTTLNTNSDVPAANALGGNAADTLWCTWSEPAGNSVLVQGVSPFAIATTLATKLLLIATSAVANVVGVAPSATAGKARVWANDTGTASRSQMRGVKTQVGAATADGSQITVPAVKMARKPFSLNGRYYSAFYNDDSVSNKQSNFFVADWTDDVNYLRPVANPAPGLASIGLTGKGKFVPGTTATTLYAGFGIKRSAVADGSVLLELDFANGRRWQTAIYGSSTCLAAAVPSYFDGVRVAEIGFLYRPPVPTTALSATGITGTYRYVAVYEETDADGNWHVSGLSDPSASVSPSNQTITVTTAPLAISARLSSLGSKPRGVRVAWYRTGTGGVAPYYRLGTTLNDSTALAATVSFVDSVNDTTLTAQSKLYSQPGVIGTAQDRRPPPSFSCVVSYGGMLVGASGQDVWFSGQDVRGEGTWFNPIFQVPVGGEGDITALGVMDGALFVFKRREVYVMSGEPPADNGAGGLGIPRRLATDVGCIDSRSTCTTAVGIFFQSDRGIEILTRAQTVEWIGEGIDATASAYPVCTSITVEPLSNTVLVELATTESAGLVSGLGCTAVYDLSLRSWVSKDIRTAGAVVAAPSQSACMVYTGSVTGWRYAWLSTAGVTYYETPGTSLDSGAAWITSLVETASAKHGLQQGQRIWSGMVLFSRDAAAGLKVEMAYNYGPYSAADDRVWTEAQTLGQKQLEFRPRSESPAIRFRISDTAPAVLGTGQGLTFIGLSLDAAAKQGTTTGTPRLDPSLRK